MDNENTAMTTVQPGTKIFCHQVSFSKKKQRFLQLEDGTLLKPVQKHSKGNREVKFYQDVFDSSCDDVISIIKLLPNYLGLWYFPDQPEDRYLHMEDVTGKFTKPCTADIKVGSRRLDPSSPVIEFRYHTVLELGYQIQGMKVYHPSKDTYTYYTKRYCRSLKETNIIRLGLGRFLNRQECLREDVAKEIVKKLLDLQHWFRNQRSFAFHSTSLLLVYEGATSLAESSFKNKNFIIEKEMNILERTRNEKSPLLDIRLIDFEYVKPSNDRDVCMIEGLTNLINAFKTLTVQ